MVYLNVSGPKFVSFNSESNIIPNGKPQRMQISEGAFQVYHSFASAGNRLLFEVLQESGHRLDVFVNPDSPPTRDEWYMAGTRAA